MMADDGMAGLQRVRSNLRYTRAFLDELLEVTVREVEVPRAVVGEASSTVESVPTLLSAVSGVRVHVRNVVRDDEVTDKAAPRTGPDVSPSTIRMATRTRGVLIM
jgi:hypothetical protein